MRIAIASGKGGTGKTTLSVNLALKLAESKRTALIDLDVEEPNGSIFLKGKLINSLDAQRMVPVWEQKKCNLCGKCPAHCLYNAVIRLGDYILVMPELCHSCHACSELCPADALPMQASPLGVINHFQERKLDFLESRLEIGLEMATPLINQALAYTDKHFATHEYQILDSPPGTSCSMIAAVQTADYSILVTEPTPFGLYDLTLAVETLRHLSQPFGVVVNRWGIGNNDVIEYLEKENIPLIAKIDHQRDIASFYSQGKILYRDFPTVNTALEAIISHLEALK